MMCVQPGQVLRVGNLGKITKGGRGCMSISVLYDAICSRVESVHYFVSE